MTELLKVCKACLISKPFSCFNKSKTCKYGIRSECKDCRKKEREENRAERSEYDRKQYAKNKDKLKKERDLKKKPKSCRLLKICKACLVDKSIVEFGIKKDGKDGLDSSCKDCQRTRGKKYRVDNKEKCSEYSRMHYYADHQLSKNKSKRYYDENRYQILQKSSIRSKNNRPKINTWINKKCQEDDLFKAKRDVRTLILSSFTRKGLIKSRGSEEILGCTLEFFKEYIDRLLLPGMTWQNHSLRGWHMDHIIPLKTANTVEDVIKLCHYTNFQPLWAIDNLRKGGKLPEEYDKIKSDM